MIKSVLIANRGEIACRILRTAHRLGIRTVVVYSEADAFSLAVQMANEAYAIGPPPVSESYLNIPKILEAARQANVEAIHPGYGFLSENEAFAKSCHQAGFLFIGPSLEALQKMGSKSEAKAIARKAGVPVIPGYEGNQENLAAQADRLGYPLMIKAIMGGGGKGMRHVKTKADFQKSFEACQREALASFGKEDVLLEKYIPTPRHIEVQIFGDTYGNLVHLFERDCSLQRRHQKVMEEAPSSLPKGLKEKLYKAALKLGQVIHYVGAGTVEFLVDQEGQFYFMEMNTRLQVEHPVTEAITGLDLVEWQFRVASGERLPLSQKEITSHGHAFELRLYAEDPHHNFKPVSGQVWVKKVPEAVRFETGLHPQDKIAPYYDPLLAKLILKGENRHETLQKAKLALENLEILGLKTNASFLKRLLSEKAFLENNIDGGYIDRYLNRLIPPQIIPENVYIMASLIKVLSETQHPLSPWDEEHKWRLEGYAPRSFDWVCEGEVKTIFLTYSPQGWIYNPWIASPPMEARNDVPQSTSSLRGSIATEPIQKKTLNAYLSNNTLFFPPFHIPFWESEEKLSLIYEGETYVLISHAPLWVSSHKKKSESHLKAPMTGKVVLILVKEEESVKENQPLLILEAMKMEHMITSPRKGRVKHIFYEIGDIVEEGEDVMDISEEETAHGFAKKR